MMKKVWLICSLVVFLSLNAYAEYIIKGSVYDAESNQAMSSARASLLNAKDSTFVKGQNTDEKGNFEIKDIEKGDYLLKISFIGYDVYWKTDFKLSGEVKTIDIGKVNLIKGGVLTDAVVVTAEKPLITFDKGKTIVNIDANPAAQNGSAVDALKTAPMVEVSPDGGIKLRGNSNIKIQIDGKPVEIFGQETKKTLEQIPAATVDNIEINTNPSAKYDAEGVTGIINFVLKKKKDLGLNGFIDLSAGTRNSYNGSLNLNYRKDELNIFGGYSFYFGKNPYSSEILRTSYNTPDAMYFKSISDGDGSYLGQHGNLGIDYDINDEHSITISANIGLSKNKSDGTFSGKYSNFSNSVYLTDYQSSNSESPYDSWGLSGFYKFKIDTGGQQLTCDLYSYHWSYNSNSSTNVNRFDADNNPIVHLLTNKTKSDNSSDNLNIELNYELPITEDIDFEAGIKGYYDYTRNISKFEYYNSIEDIWFVNNDQSTDYDNTKLTYSAYSILSHKVGDFNYRIGLRAEHFTTKGNIISKVMQIEKSYFDVFPNFSMSYAFSPFEKIQFSYSMRTERPWFWNLVPYEDRSNPNHIRAGNPDLKPSYTHSFEIGTINMFGSHSFSPSVFYRRELESIERYSYINSEGVLYSTSGNFANSHNYGFDLGYNGSFFGFMSLGVSGSYYFYDYNVELPNNKYSKSDKSWSANGNFSLFPIEGLFISGFCYYSPAAESAFGKSKEMVYMNFGARLELFDGKIELNMNISDPFKLIDYGNITRGLDYMIESQYKFNSQSISIGIQYKINDGFKSRDKGKGGASAPPSGGPGI